MKVAFIYGGADYYIGEHGRFYSSGTVTTEVWERYLKYFNEIIALGREAKLKKDLKNMTDVTHDNVEIAQMPALNGSKNLIFKSGEVRKKCRETLLKVDCAIIRLPSIAGVIACQEAQRLKKPYIVEVVGCIKDALWFHGSMKGKLTAQLFYQLNKKTIKKAPYAIYVTQEFLQTRYPSKGILCGCSDVTLKMPSEFIFNKRKQKIEGYTKDTVFNIGMIGSLNVDYKGHATAFEALSLLKDKINIKLHILGDGNKEKWIALSKKLNIEDKVSYDGVLPSGEAVYNWMDKLDLYITPSYTEGLPRAVVEAMSRALPIVASNVGGLPELLSEENLFQVKDHRELSVKILNILGDKNRILKEAQRNFNQAKYYDEENLNQIRNGFYEKFLQL